MVHPVHILMIDEHTGDADYTRLKLFPTWCGVGKRGGASQKTASHMGASHMAFRMLIEEWDMSVWYPRARPPGLSA